MAAVAHLKISGSILCEGFEPDRKHGCFLTCQCVLVILHSCWPPASCTCQQLPADVYPYSPCRFCNCHSILSPCLVSCEILLFSLGDADGSSCDRSALIVFSQTLKHVLVCNPPMIWLTCWLIFDLSTNAIIESPACCRPAAPLMSVPVLAQGHRKRGHPFKLSTTCRQIREMNQMIWTLWSITEQPLK